MTSNPKVRFAKEPGGGVSTRLDTIETSVHRPPQVSYRDSQLIRVGQEHAKSLWLYDQIDHRDGKSRRERYEECRSYAYFIFDRETQKIRVAANACKLRWCPLCSKAKTARLQFSVSGWLRETEKPKLITLTLRHTNAPLPTQISHLYKHFRNLRRNPLFKKIVSGGVWFFQVKRNESGSQWHPHLHCCCDSDFFPKQQLSSLWESITQTSRIVDIKAIDNPEEVAKYVARYCARPAKLADYSYSDCVEIFDALHGRRLCGSWGTAFGIALARPQEEEPGRTIRIAKFSEIVKYWSKSQHIREVWKAYLTGSVISEKTADAVSRYVGDEFVRAAMAALEVCDLPPPN